MKPTTIRPPITVSSGSGSGTKEKDDPTTQDRPEVTVNDLVAKPDVSSVIRSDDEDDDDLKSDSAPEKENGAVDEIEDIEEETDSGILWVHKEDCLNCGHLVVFKAKKRMPCHFSTGNKDCPAQSVVVAIRLETKSVVTRVMAAEASNDTDTLSKFYAKLSTLPDWKRAQFLEALDEARAERVARSNRG